MTSLSCLLAILGAIGLVGPEPLKVTARPEAGPYHVGQAIEIRVEAKGGDAPVDFEPPKAPNVEINSRGVVPNARAIGRFLVIPRRAGVVEIPPFHARSGDRVGASRPTRLTVLNVPVEGRGPAFLGGVGTFEVRGEAEPTTLRAGQVLEYRIKLTGPAAWGSDRSPDLTGWASLGEGLRVETLPNVLDPGEPPVRTFRYRLRTLGAGRLVLPPVAVAGFDPGTGRFSTRTTSGLPILVERPPILDPKAVDYERRKPAADLSIRGWIAVGLGLVVLAFGTLGLRWIDGRRRRPKAIDRSRLASEMARDLEGSAEVEPARRVVEALTAFLERIDRRPLGVLTPPEAFEAFGRLTSKGELGQTAERLVMACDRARYGDQRGDSAGLIDEGRLFFERVAEALREGQEPGGPREAVETA